MELFDNIGGDDIPQKTIANPPARMISYVLHMTPDPETGELNLQLDPPVGVIQKYDLQMQVPEPCIITIRLANDWNWRFVQKAIKLGPTATSSTTKPNTRYHNLSVTDRLLSFVADHNNDGHQDNSDPCNILVSLTQAYTKANGETGEITCWLTIDPDIKNPGDNVFLPPPP
jgi:hypothetical protein